MNGGRACHAFEASRCDAINFAANWPLPFPSAFPSRPSYTLSLFSTACDINSWSLEREGLEQTRGSRANNALQVARSPSATFRQLFRGSRISRCCNKIARFDPNPSLLFFSVNLHDKSSSRSPNISPLVITCERNRCKVKIGMIIPCTKFLYRRYFTSRLIKKRSYLSTLRSNYIGRVMASLYDFGTFQTGKRERERRKERKGSINSLVPSGKPSFRNVT